MFVTMKIFCTFGVYITISSMGNITSTIILSNKELCNIFDLTRECFGIDEFDISTLHDSFTNIASIRSSAPDDIALGLDAEDYKAFIQEVFENKHTICYLADFEGNGLQGAMYAMYLIDRYIEMDSSIILEEDHNPYDEAKSNVYDDMLKLYRLCKQVESGKFPASKVEISVPDPINKTTDKGVGRESIVLDNWNDWLFSKALSPFLERFITDIDTLDKANKKWVELHPLGRKCDYEQEAIIYGCYRLLKKYCKSEARIPSSVCVIISNYVRLVLPYNGEDYDPRTAENIASRLKHIMRQGKQPLLNSPFEYENLKYSCEQQFEALLK